MTKQEREDLEQRISNASALVKLACGTANNAAWLVVLDGLDHAKRCKRYGYRVRGAFNQAIKEWHDYEARLKYATVNCMFRLSDMPLDVRKKYGDITDAEFYDFWASIGGPAYIRTKPLITSLCDKQRLSLEHHNVQDAEHVAWVLTASAALDIAVSLHERVLAHCVKTMNIPVRQAHRVFDQFSLGRVLKAWNKALTMLAPDSKYELEETEKHNIELGAEELFDAWTEPTLMYRSTMQSVEDYDEVFASRRYQKKVMREIAGVEKETLKELNQQ